MNNTTDDANPILTEWDNFEYNSIPIKNISPNITPNATDLLSTQALIQQINILNKKLHQSQEIITKERTEKQNTIKLLKTKVNEINNLHTKFNQMNENIKCRQEHIAIEQNNYKNAKNKIAYLITKLREAEKIIQQKNKAIHDLKIDHEESMRRAKILIEEFYQDKFFEEPVYQEFDEIHEDICA
jgi:chromosome segregation ATPase